MDAEESRWKETGSVRDALLQKTASYQMAGFPDQRIYQNTIQSSTHHHGQSQASQARAIWSHMPHAGQQNIKESVVWGGGRSQLPGTTKEALGRRHTEVVRHDTTTGVTSCAGCATWRNLIAGPYGSWTTGQEEEEELYTSAVCEETLCIRSYYTEWSPVLNSHMWYF